MCVANIDPNRDVTVANVTRTSSRHYVQSVFYMCVGNVMDVKPEVF